MLKIITYLPFLEGLVLQTLEKSRPLPVIRVGGIFSVVKPNLGKKTKRRPPFCARGVLAWLFFPRLQRLIERNR